LSARSIIEHQAYEWLALMQSDNKTELEVERFQAWLAASAEHSACYREIEQIWSSLAGLALPQGRDDRSDPIVSNISSFPIAMPRRTEEPLPTIQPALANNLPTKSVAERHRLLLPSLVACFLMVVMASIFFVSPWSPSAGISQGEYATDTAEVKKIVLADQSVVTLGAQSAIQVDFAETERRVELLSGAAFFSVTKDKSRPFIVVTSDAEVRVVGTQFEVSRLQEGLNVSVLDGVVEVVDQILPAVEQSVAKRLVANKHVLVKNQMLRLSRDDLTVPAPVMIEAEQPGAWRNGRLIYTNAPLADVISDVNRYYNGNIIIDTDDLKYLPVSASFKTDQIDKMMNTLSAVLPITVVNLSNGDIILRRK